MSYKYLYGFTNEPSYDFTKVIYFGKQDRCESALSRIPEHYSEDDPNHEALKNAKYVLVSAVDTLSPLPDLEAYFIQTYKPQLNTIYNEDKDCKEKLNAAELQEIKGCAEDLDWMLIENSAKSAKNIEWTINEIGKRNQIIKTATYIFESEKEILQTTCADVVRKIDCGTAVIRPELPNTLISPLLVVTATDSSVFIDYYNRTDPWCSKHYKELHYQKICGRMEIPELIVVTNPIVSYTKLHFEDDFVKTEEFALAEDCVFDIWLKLMFFISRKLTLVEPQFTESLKIKDFSKGINYLANLNGGFHSSNWGYIDGIAKLLYTDKYPDEFALCHFRDLFDYDEDVEKISNMIVSDFVSDVSDSCSDATEDDIMYGQTTYREWIFDNCGCEI